MKAHVALCIFLVGCVADPPSDEDFSTAESQIALERCSSFECGNNSPVIAAAELWDLPEAFNVPNAQGYSIIRVRHPSSSPDVRIDVINDEIKIKRLVGDVVVAEGYAVVGATIDLLKTENGQPRWYQVKISEVGKTPYWAKPFMWFGSPPMSWTYRLGWRSPQDQAGTDPTFTPICGENPDPDGLDDFFAVVYADEQISASQIKVLTPHSNWFNIGCAGHSLSKLHLMGYTLAAASKLIWPSTVNMRTATLKMLTADYCGTGRPMTVAGQALMWRSKDMDLVPDNAPSAYVQGPYNDTTGLLSSTLYHKGLEARWSEHGATCLNTPRVDYKRTTDNIEAFPHGIDGPHGELAAWCTNGVRPPTCRGTWADPQSESIISVNYKRKLIALPL